MEASISGSSSTRGVSLTEGIIDGINGPVAFVGIAEKGCATIRLKAPSRGRAFVDAAAAHGRRHGREPWSHRLESNPSPVRIDGPVAVMLDYLGPEMPLAPAEWPWRIAG